jgi:enamine deaminase RidA (YjgF/YER057c/UK114 family)
MTLRKYALLPLFCLLGFAGWAQNRTVNQKKATKEKRTMEKQQTNVRFINRAPVGYSHVVEVKGGRTLYISGQIALDKDGNLVGRNDFRAQVKQVFENLKARLEEGGASFKDVVKLNYYLTDASGVQAVRDIRNNYINTESPPASTLVVVKQLVSEEYLIEVEAIAVVSE